MLNLQITLEDDGRSRALLERLRGMPAIALRAVVAGMSEAGPIVVGRALRERFRGKGPFPVVERRLGRVTGKLSQSMRASAPQAEAGKGEVSQEFGSNLGYFAAHEFGYDGPVFIKAHTRKVRWNNLKGGKRTGAKFGKAQTQAVRPHTRMVHVPRRAPLTAALEEEATTAIYYRAIRRELLAAVDREGGVA